MRPYLRNLLIIGLSVTLLSSFTGCLESQGLIEKPASDMILTEQDLGGNWSTYPGDPNYADDYSATVYLYYPSPILLERERSVHSVLRVFNSTQEAKDHFQWKKETAEDFVELIDKELGDEGFEYILQDNHTALLNVRIDNVFLEMTFEDKAEEVSTDSQWISDIIELQVSKIAGG